jgi:hypothetical protein
MHILIICRYSLFIAEKIHRDSILKNAAQLDLILSTLNLAKRFQRRTLLKIGQSETRIACGGHVW